MNHCRRSLAAAAILALAAGCASRDRPRAGLETGADNAAVDALFASWDTRGSPGCALAVARDGNLVYSRGYGYANLDYDIPITPRTVFDVASVTKQFVAALANMLALEGKLSLDDDVRKWLPELPEYEAPITLRHLIHHTGGLRDYLNLFPLAGAGDYYSVSREQLLAMMSRQRAPVFPPGERYEYSNTGYMLLAHALERAGGKSLGELARERIFEPLGMESSLMYENRERIIPRRATGYHRDDDGRLRMVHNYNFEIAGDGQLYTTVEDLLRWDDYLHGADKPPIHGSMLTEGTLNNGDGIGYAQGITPGEYRGLRTVGHGGHSWGFLTELRRYVEPGLSIAISCNAEYGDPGELARRVADHYLADQLGPEGSDEDEEDDSDEEDAEEPSAAPSLSSAELAAFAGSFFSAELDATYRFAVVDGSLTLRIEQEPSLDVTPVAEDEFEVRFESRGWAASPGRLEFERNASGAVTGFSLSSGSERGLVFERRPALDILLPDYLPEPAYNGLTLAEIAEVRGADPETTLMELLKADTEAGGESMMLGFAMDEPDIESIMAWPHTVIGSDGGLAGSHPRGFGAFTRFLGHYVRNRNVVSLEEGIRKTTSLSAQHMGITERGSIREGHYADLVLFDPDAVTEQSTYEEPHIPSLGIEKVWVNGQLVFDGSEATGNRPGRSVRRTGS